MKLIWLYIGLITISIWFGILSDRVHQDRLETLEAQVQELQDGR